MDNRNKLSNTAKPDKISTKDFFNFTSLWRNTMIVIEFATNPTKDIRGITIPST